MDVPITKPSMVSYADEVNIAQLLENLLKDRHNGFMRVTAGADEGYILFKDGNQVAAEYDRFSKSQAIESILTACKSNNTLIEVFDLRPSHIDYLLDVNKPFIMEPDYDANKVIDELKGTNVSETVKPEDIAKSDEISDSNYTSDTVSEAEPAPRERVNESEPKVEHEAFKEEKTDQEAEKTEPSVPKPEQVKAEIGVTETESDPNTATTEVTELDSEPEINTDPEPIPDTTSKPATEPMSDPTLESVNELISNTATEPVTEKTHGPINETATEKATETVTEPANKATESVTELKPDIKPSIKKSKPESQMSNDLATKEEKVSEVEDAPKPESDSAAIRSKESLKKELKTIDSKPETEIEPQVKVKEKPIDRSKLLEKYGIKEMNEDDVDGLLEDYKGGSLNDEDVEKIEFSLMNKIKKSIFGIPKIRGAEVMVFLENNAELTGDVNIIIEYDAKGFLSRLMGESKDIEKLRRQIINIVQIEIKKSFRKYPEIVSNFNINVEIG